MTTLPPGFAWAIKDFETKFTVSQAARNAGRWSWMAFPIKLDGFHYRTLVRQEGGLAAYGAFCAMASLAANCPHRGVLAGPEGPYTPSKIAVYTDLRSGEIEAAIRLLSRSEDPEIGWLYQVEISALGAKPGNAPSNPGRRSEQNPAALGARGEEKRREEKRAEEIRAGRQKHPEENSHVFLPLAQDGRATEPDRVVFVSDLPACLPELEVAGLLAQLGVDEPVRSRLVAKGVTIAQVQDAHAAAKRGEPRRWRHVMIADLQRRAGVKRGDQAALGEGVSREAQRLTAEIERMRKARGLTG